MLEIENMVIARTAEELTSILGLTAAEADEWQAQLALLRRLRRLVQDEGLTVSEMARRGQLSRARVASILAGNLDRVSSDLLIRLVTTP